MYDGKWPGIGPFELHMGPYHEFALFRGIQDEHRDHSSAENLLKPYNVEVRANRLARAGTWTGMHLEVALAGGSREQCETWFVTLKRSDDLRLPLIERLAEVIRPSDFRTTSRNRST